MYMYIHKQVRAKTHTRAQPVFGKGFYKTLETKPFLRVNQRKKYVQVSPDAPALPLRKVA